MILAPSRGNLQLLVSRVVFAQVSNVHSPPGQGMARCYHNISSGGIDGGGSSNGNGSGGGDGSKSGNGNKGNIKGNSHISQHGNQFHCRPIHYLPRTPLILPSSCLSTSLFSMHCINLLGTYAKRAISTTRKFGIPQKQTLYISSPAQLINPFLPPTQYPSMFTLRGWALRFRSLKSKFTSLISAQQIKNILKPFKEKFSSRSFRHTADQLYNEINKAIAEADVGKLRGLVTETMYSSLAKEFELKVRSSEKLHNISWTAKLETPEVVCVRYTRVSAGKLEDFGQVTVEFKGTQTVSVNDVSGKVVSSKSTLIAEFWTFERHLQKFSSWKLCAKPTRESIENLTH